VIVEKQRHRITGSSLQVLKEKIGDRYVPVTSKCLQGGFFLIICNVFSIRNFSKKSESIERSAAHYLPKIFIIFRFVTGF
jgi:hypothetical protein